MRGTLLACWVAGFLDQIPKESAHIKMGRLEQELSKAESAQWFGQRNHHNAKVQKVKELVEVLQLWQN